ncbi:MAG: hypothetical protein JST62_14615 [Bacteroidetes bacterium]|nr:hypothetical protein [Bacteroidota bacterium]
MLVNEKISIFEFDDKSYQIKLATPLEEEKAVLTHYLHNIHNGVSKHYKKEAVSILKNFVEYKIENNTSIVAEEALQQLLFEVENVPFPTPKNYSFKFIA